MHHDSTQPRAFLRFSKLAVSPPFQGPKNLAKIPDRTRETPRKVANFQGILGTAGSRGAELERQGRDDRTNGWNEDRDSRKVGNFWGSPGGSGAGLKRPWKTPPLPCPRPGGGPEKPGKDPEKPGKDRGLRKRPGKGRGRAAEKLAAFQENQGSAAAIGKD